MAKKFYKRKGSDKKKSDSKPKKQQRDSRIFYVGSGNQAADYIVSREQVITDIKVKFDCGDDIGTALEKGEHFDFEKVEPQLKVSTATDDAVKAAQDKVNATLFDKQMEVYAIRMSTYDSNVIKAYAFIWQRCAKSMRQKIESRADYASKIKDNPFELLNAIKEHALNYRENRYQMCIIFESLRNFVLLTQGVDESVTEYSKRFKHAKDVFESHLGGCIILTKFVRSMPGYDQNDRGKVEELVKKAWAMLVAFIFIYNANRKKYASMTTFLATQYALKQDQYPKTLEDAINT